MMVKSYYYLGYKWHIVNKFKDKQESLFVVKRWRKAKQRWYYEVLDEWMLNYILEEVKGSHPQAKTVTIKIQTDDCSGLIEALEQKLT